MNRVFGSAGQRVGQRIFLRLLEHHRVVDDRGRLLGNPIEQPAVIVGVDRRLGVIDGDRPDEPLVEDAAGRPAPTAAWSRSDGMPAGLEVGARAAR